MSAAPLRRIAGGLVPWVTAAALLGAWQVAVRLSGTDPLVLPAPSEVAAAAWRDRELLWPALLHTIKVLLLGLLLASALGLLAGIALHLSRPLRRALEPVLIASQAIPVPILAPLLVLWLGFGLAAQVAVVVIIAFFPLAVAARDGLRELPPEVSLVLDNLAMGRLRRLQLVELPHALPQLLTGLRLAVVFAVIGAVFADSTGTTVTTADAPSGTGGGLGRTVADALPQLQTDRAFAAVLLLVALSLLLFWIVGGARRLADRRSSPSLRRITSP